MTNLIKKARAKITGSWMGSDPFHTRNLSVPRTGDDQRSPVRQVLEMGRAFWDAERAYRNDAGGGRARQPDPR